MVADDLGIQYQSYSDRDDIVVEDEFLTVHPGIGHTGSHAFETYHGWFRAIRGPCGAFSYTATLRSWTAQTHTMFPAALKSAVLTMLLGQQRHGTVLSLLPKDTVLQIMEHCDWGWFEGCQQSDEDADEEDEEGEAPPTMEELMCLLPEHRRASIEHSLSIMGEQQQLRAIARLWERYDGQRWRRQQQALASLRLQRQMWQDDAWGVFGADDSSDESRSADAASGSSDSDSDAEAHGRGLMSEPDWVRRYYAPATRDDEDDDAVSAEETSALLSVSAESLLLAAARDLALQQQDQQLSEAPLIVEDLDALQSDEPEPEPEPEPALNPEAAVFVPASATP